MRPLSLASAFLAGSLISLSLAEIFPNLEVPPANGLCSGVRIPDKIGFSLETNRTISEKNTDNFGDEHGQVGKQGADKLRGQSGQIE